MTRWDRVAVGLMVLGLVAGYVAGSGRWSGTRSARDDGPSESAEANGWVRWRLSMSE